MSYPQLQIVFMGTPEFAAPSLQRLVDDRHQVVAVYTQPDRPAGRSGAPSPPPVKRLAERLGLLVRQPRSLRREEAQQALRELAPDLLVVAAYGLILPQAVLDIPRLGGLNVHPSLLPRHRGPAPVVGALLAGDQETGISIMLMDAGMDTGPVLTQRRSLIAPEDTAGTLTERLAREGAFLLGETIPLWAKGELTPQLQDPALATYTKLLTKEDSIIDWTAPAPVLARRVRAYQPWPGAATTWQGKALKVLAAEAADQPETGHPPGTVMSSPGGFRGAAVQTGQGLLLLWRVQLEGKRPLTIEEFLRGAPGFIGSRLGDPSAPSGA